ncbi:MAG TPA: ROK family protein [Candidatus Saccharimonadia bacterium]|nr:ROK family protein [Candidatus Saccharimonadia bacterium]
MYLVFDIGGTHTRLGLSANGRKLDQVVHLETDSSAAGLEAFLGATSTLAAGRTLRAVAGGLPGHMAVDGRLGYAPNLPGWVGLAVADRLQERLGVKVLVENDAALAGLAEACLGAGAGRRIVTYITVSTGVNGVRIVDGGIDSSAQGFEIGQQLLADHNGQLASLESLTGGAALARRTGRLPAELQGTGTWQVEVQYLARGLFNTLVHWSPEIVVYGGRMMQDISVAAIAEELSRLPAVLKPWPPIVTAQLGDDGGLLGALLLLRGRDL